MICARDVTVTIGRATLVDGVSLDVAPEEVVALVGPNGAGKSTLLGALAGDRRLARGSVELGGRAIAAMSAPELATRRAVLAQRVDLAVAFTALETVMLADVSESRARRLLDELELRAFADRSMPTMSGGEQQRVHLARVLAQLASCPGAALFLDEPLAALDPRHQIVACRRVRLAASDGHPVVIVMHDLAVAARFADRVVVLSEGRAIADAPPAVALVPETLERAYRVAFVRRELLVPI